MKDAESGDGSNDIVSQSLSKAIKSLRTVEKHNISQSNTFIEAAFIQPFEENELKTLYILTSYVNRKKYVNEDKVIKEIDENKIVREVEGKYMKITMSKSDFCEELKISPLNFYRQMDYLSERITNKRIRIRDGDKTLVLVLIPAVEYDKGQVTFYINSMLHPYLQDLTENYTRFSKIYVENMGSSHAMRIYTLLKSKRYLVGYDKYNKEYRGFTIEIEELKRILGIPDRYQNRFDLFKKEVLLPAREKINATDLKIDFEMQREGRRVKGICFKIEDQKTQLQQALELFKNEMKHIFTQNISVFQEEHRKVSKIKVTKIESEESLLIFDNWIQARTDSIDFDTKSTLRLLPQKKYSEYSDVPQWYMNYLEQRKQNTHEITLL
jgi:plasmid replication initiation protein